MTIRLSDPPLAKTSHLLFEVLKVVMQGERACFLCPAGTSEALLARLRMSLSRQRTKMRAKGRRIQEFQLYSSVHPETHDGVRYDCIVLWRVQAPWQQAEMELNALLGFDSPADEGATA